MPLPVLRPHWETLAQLASRWSKSLDLDVCPMPSTSSHRFCGTTDKPWPTWFWGPKQETIVVILRPKTPNRSLRFWVPNRETVDIVFEAISRNPNPPVLRPNREKPSTLVLLPNQETSAPRLLVHGADYTQRHPTSRSSGHRVLDHPLSSTPGILLLPRSSSLLTMPHLSPAHHETSKCDSPHKIDSRVEP
jgi:hypothetical protein